MLHRWIHEKNVRTIAFWHAGEPPNVSCMIYFKNMFLLLCVLVSGQHINVFDDSNDTFMLFHENQVLRASCFVFVHWCFALLFVGCSLQWTDEFQLGVCNYIKIDRQIDRWMRQI